MKKILFLGLLSVTMLCANQYSLKGLTHTINISTNTVDTNEVIEKTKKQIKKIDFAKLKSDKKSSNKHQSRIKKADDNLKQLSFYRTQLELGYIDQKQLEEQLSKAKKQYDKNINRIYKKNKQIDRYSYIIVVSKGDIAYKKDLENFVIEHYAIKKYDQTTTLEKSLQSMEMQSTIKTEKEFGQKSVDTVYDYVIRAKDINFKVFKVTQNPFVKLSSKSTKQTTKTSNDMFEESKVFINDLSAQEFSVLQNNLQKKYNIEVGEIEPFIKTLKSKVNIVQQQKEFKKSTKSIVNVLNKLEKQHKKELSKISNIQDEYLTKKQSIVHIEPKLNTLLVATQKLLKPYNIALTKETIGNISLVTPKVYIEKVAYKEEKEYILRKVKSYISKLNVADLKQSDTLIDFEDLTSTTKNTQKAIKYETIHTLPYLAKNNKIALLVFGSISIKEELTEDDLLSFDMKFTELKFIPIKKGYKTIFAGQKEVTLGLVKEFLEKNSQKKYFDQYCIDESFLPEEAKNYKKVDEEFYDYPAVCFKVDKIGKFLKWISKKTNRDIVIPSSEDWGYVASNGETTDYCWGNESPEELMDEEMLPENIYLENNEDESTLKKVAQFPKSKSGLFDMCGNVFELTKDEDELTYKGNSFSSYIDVSVGEGESYADDVNSNLGLRLFYIKDLTNE